MNKIIVAAVTFICAATSAPAQSLPKKEFFDKVWKLSDVEKAVSGTVGGR